MAISFERFIAICEPFKVKSCDAYEDNCSSPLLGSWYLQRDIDISDDSSDLGDRFDLFFAILDLRCLRSGIQSNGSGE